jgi:hypothetical protein
MRVINNCKLWANTSWRFGWVDGDEQCPVYKGELCQQFVVHNVTFANSDLFTNVNSLNSAL